MKKVMAILFAAALAFSAASCATPAAGISASPALSAAPQSGSAISTDDKAVARYSKQLSSVAAQDFSLTDLNGKKWTLSELKGKIVLLNFWATWCGPCQREMPEFQKVYDRYGDNGDVVLLAVASSGLENDKDALSGVKQFAEKERFTFPILYDSDGSVWGVYQQEGVPSNYIIDTKGNVRLLKVGAFSGEADIYAALEAVRRADSGK